MPFLVLFRLGDRVHPYRAPSNQDHLGVSDVERLPTRHVETKRAEAFCCNVLEHLPRGHHGMNLLERVALVAAIALIASARTPYRIGINGSRSSAIAAGFPRL